MAGREPQSRHQRRVLVSEWVRTQIQLTKEQHERVKRLAFEAGISMAEWLRRATEEKLARDDKEGE